MSSADRVALAADVFGSLSDRDRPQGIAAVVQIGAEGPELGNHEHTEYADPEIEYHAGVG